MQKKKYLSEILLLLGLSLIFLAILFNKFFTNPFYYFAADNAELYFPMWVYLNKSIHSLQMPLLNRFWFAGSLPFAALETNVFYPVYLAINLFFKAEKNLNNAYFFYFATQLLHYLIASVSFYLVARVGLRFNKFTSLFGALIYSMSGSFVGRFVHPVFLQTLAWFPLIYLLLILYSRTKKLVYALGCSVVLSLIAFSGHPQMIYYVFLYYAFAVFYFFLFESKQEKIRFFLVALLIVLVALLISAPKILLSLELSQNIVRTTAETTIKNLYNSIHPFYYLTLLVPYFFGKHVVGYWGSEYPWGNWENFIYIGIIPILLVPLAFGWKNKRLLVFFLINLLATFFLLLGRYSSLSALINQKMPLSESLTMLSKFTMFLHFFLVIIATAGIQNIRTINKNKNYLVGMLIYISILGILIFSLKPEWIGKLGLTDRPAPVGEAVGFILKNIKQARILFSVSVLFIFIALLIKQKRLIYLLLIIYALDIFLTAGNFNPIEETPGPPSVFFSRPEAVLYIKSDKSLFRTDNLWPRNMNMIYDLETTYGYHTVETKAYHEAISQFNFQNRKIIDLMNVKYLLSEQDLGVNEGIRPVKPTLWENKNFLPRIFFVEDYKLFKTKEDLQAELLSSDFNPKQTVLLESNTFRLAKKNKPGLISKSSLNIHNYSDRKIEFDFNSRSKGFIVFGQFRYPGWYALIDGKKTSLIPANLFMYALPISSGSHKVSFIYKSKPLDYGLILSFLTMALVLFSLLNKKIRKIYLTKEFPVVSGKEG